MSWTLVRSEPSSCLTGMTPCARLRHEGLEDRTSRKAPTVSSALSAGNHSCGMNLLIVALPHSAKVVVGTIAGEAWVPALIPTIQSCEIVSARDRWEPHGFTFQVDWKKDTQRNSLCPSLCRFLADCDSECERWALLATMCSRPTSQFDTCRTKIVRFQRERSAGDFAW